MTQRDNGSPRPRSNVLLLVDNHPKSVEAIRSDVEKLFQDWAVEIVETPEEAIDRVASRSKPALRLISIDLGLGRDPEGDSEGLKLLAQLKKTQLPLVVHSAQTLRPETLRTIIKTPASYIRTRDKKGLETFPKLVPILADGYIVCSPAAAVLLPEVMKPDPLDDEQWELLKLLADEEHFHSEEVIAEMYRKSSATISYRIAAMVERLQNGGFISAEAATKGQHRRMLTKFYRENRAKYGH